MERGFVVRARDDAHAAFIANSLSNFLSSGDVKYVGEVIRKVDDELYEIILRGGQEDDREAKTLC